ncbi:MAG: DUF4350 domain-containing protein [Candidatus Thermochlorobacter sp.]
MRTYWKPLLFASALLTLLVAVQLSAPKPLDWKPTFTSMDKNPFGTYILCLRLSDLFPNQKIIITKKSLYEFFTLSRETDFQPDQYLDNGQWHKANLIMINQHLNLDSLDTQMLLGFVSAGNSAFLAASNFGNLLADTLCLKIKNSIWSPFSALPDSDTLLTNFSLAAHRRALPYYFPRIREAYVFSSFDSMRTTVLGIDDEQRPNFIRVQFGEGAFYLCSNPYLFTNYHLLSEDGAEYVAKALSYLPVQETLWDEYYKSVKPSQSPLRFVLENDTLRYAYYLALLGVALFIFVEGKRRQRAIPTVLPPQNRALEFVETVGRLYFQYGHHKDLAEKKIRHFLDFIRTHFYLTSVSFSAEFYTMLSEKSGVAQQEIEQLFRLIEHANRSSALSEDDLLRLIDAIEQFKTTIASRSNAKHALPKSH